MEPNIFKRNLFETTFSRYNFQFTLSFSLRIRKSYVPGQISFLAMKKNKKDVRKNMKMNEKNL